MIQAIKNTTLTGVQVRTLSIRQKELEYWKTTFTTMAGQSALLAGFCYGGLSLHASEDKKFAGLLSFGYLSITTAAMGFGLLTIVVAALCSMLGPGLALRGSEGAESMHKAVDTMKSESTQCFYFFVGQLLFFHISSFLLMWVLYTPNVAFVVNIVLGVFLLLFIVNGIDIFNKLYVGEEEAVSGKFQDFTQYQVMSDLDAGAQGKSYVGRAPASSYGGLRPESQVGIPSQHSVEPYSQDGNLGNYQQQQQFMKPTNNSMVPQKETQSDGVSFLNLIFGTGAGGRNNQMQPMVEMRSANARPHSESRMASPNRLPDIYNQTFNKGGYAQSSARNYEQSSYQAEGGMMSSQYSSQGRGMLQNRLPAMTQEHSPRRDPRIMDDQQAQRQMGLSFNPNDPRPKSRPRDRSPAGPQSNFRGNEAFGQGYRVESQEVPRPVSPLRYMGPPSPRMMAKKLEEETKQGQPSLLKNVGSALSNFLKVDYEQQPGGYVQKSQPRDEQLVEQMRLKQQETMNKKAQLDQMLKERQDRKRSRSPMRH